MTTRPAPDFALSFSSDAVHLLEREAGAAPDAPGWRERGTAAFGAPDFRDAMSRLRAIAAAGADAPVQLIIPDDQILYTSLPVREPADPQAAVGAALDGLTPYAVDDLAWDWRPEDAGAGVRVAAVARQTLREAEAFARRYGFSAAAFVADPTGELFPAVPRFGGSEGEAPHPASMDEEDDAMATLSDMPDDGSVDDPGTLSDEGAPQDETPAGARAGGSGDAAGDGSAANDAKPVAAEAGPGRDAAQDGDRPAASRPAGDAPDPDSAPSDAAAKDDAPASDPVLTDIPGSGAAAPQLSPEPARAAPAAMDGGAKTAAATGAALASTAGAAVRKPGLAAPRPAAFDGAAGPKSPRRIAATPAPERHPGARGGIGALLVMVGALLLGLALIWAFATPDTAPQVTAQPESETAPAAISTGAEGAGPEVTAAPAETSAAAPPSAPAPAAPAPIAETSAEPAGAETATPPPTPTLAADPVAPAASLPTIPPPVASAPSGKPPETPAVLQAEPAAGVPAPPLELPSAPPSSVTAATDGAAGPVAAAPEVAPSESTGPAATGAAPAPSAIDAAVAAALSEGAAPAADETGAAIPETGPAEAASPSAAIPPQTGAAQPGKAAAPAAAVPAAPAAAAAPAPRLTSPLSGGPPPRRPAKAAQPQPVRADAPPAVPGRKATATPGARRPPARPKAVQPAASSRPARADSVPAASKPAARPQGAAPAPAAPAGRPRPRPVEEGSADESVTAAEMTPAERRDADRLLGDLYAAHPHLPRLAPPRPWDAERHAEARPAKRPLLPGRSATDAAIDAAVKEAVTPRKKGAAEPAGAQRRRASSDAPESKPRQNAPPAATVRGTEHAAAGNRPVRRPSRGAAVASTAAAVEAAIAQAVEQSGATPGGVKLSALRSSPLPVRKPARGGSKAAPDTEAEAVAALAGSRPAADRAEPAPAPPAAPAAVPAAQPADTGATGAGDPGQRQRLDEQLQSQAEARARARAASDARAEAQARAAAEARARAQAAAEERAAIAKRGEYRPPEVDDEPEIATTARFSAASGNVAQSATVGGMDLGKTQVIGVIGAGRASRGLIRLRNGKIVTVRLGDRIDGGAINSIGNGRISYVKSGRQYNLPILNGR